ncbi:30S ribosomal protein S4 [Candidatus Pacearchaeota archaeon CG1_02_31_27]|nr:MAG: 30S ribosomal protein S4 [Candidatus Pacearchaeota archaeon CG1_02_31_27]PIN92420.1 MAG: 30S ribosomal protein S4 [Candidatus Pacearchaeota archaeon CG10_big_fil_rev_8_21_14_0_10_31_59]PIZ81005.1 MAG: 30S ribosomal protein S4 [Candidatus Pacearchaeota archaeon CG_4_10_14_0_2_um_filter_31_10]
MGEPKKSRKKFTRPKKSHDKERIDEEKKITEEYGLKNKKEIWKAEAAITRIRSQAKKSIVGEEEGKIKFMNRLIKLGLIKPNSELDDVLGLTLKNWLDRRLQTIVYKKGLANTIKHARQLIVHRKVKIKGNRVNIPSYIVKIDEEKEIEILKPIKIKKEKSEEENVD